VTDIPRHARLWADCDGPSAKEPDMADNPDARRNAESRFAASESRNKQIKAEIAKENAAFDARTIKLRAQRMAVEEEARVEKARLASLAPAKADKPAKARKKAVPR
jgi:hypothetical protein